MPNFNYANNIFSVQDAVNRCAMDILNAHADYEHNRAAQKQVQTDNDEYNELVDSYNKLLAKAKELAQYHREEKSQNVSLQQHIVSIQQQCNELMEENQNLSNAFSQKDDEVLSLKAQLKAKDQELQKAKSEVKKLGETVFTFTLVNTILSTRATALKNVLSNWKEGKIHQKHGFINALKEEAKKADFAKNQIPATNSVEAFAYLENNNKPLFEKLQDFSL